MLGYSTIAHAGYILLAFGVGTNVSVGAAVFYLAIYTLMTLGAFAVVHSVGEERSDLNYYRILQAGEVGFVVWALINGVISAYYYMRPVFYALGFEPEHVFEAKLRPALFLVMVVGLVGVLYFGLAPSGLLEFTRSVVSP